MAEARVRVGIGGWTYEPWRGNFYPQGLAQHKELEYAAQKLTAIEINATYYRLQTASSFAKWRDSTPEDFVFSVKGSRYVTNRRVLAEAGEAIDRFMASGLAELGDKLGPIVWQFATTKVFDTDDLGAFLRLLPDRLGTRKLRHALEVRHPSFMSPEYLALAREHDVATVYADSDEYPRFADLTGGFVYARLMKTQSRHETGYEAAEIAQWAQCARDWAAGSEPASLDRIEVVRAQKTAARDVFMFFISGAKERAPAAAMAALEELARLEQNGGASARPSRA
jgi:uncharacterized protein YecE (DUF72 family)